MLDSAMKSEYQRGNWVVAGGTGHKKLKNCPTMLFEDLQFPSRNITFVKNRHDYANSINVFWNYYSNVFCS